MKQDLRTFIGKDEKILWQGKPVKKCFILESIINPLLPFAIIWALIDGLVIFETAFADKTAAAIILPFMLLHMMPVWIYIGSIFFCLIRYKKFDYIITDKCVYVGAGLFSYQFQMKSFAELNSISMHRGIFDQMCKCGDIIFEIPDAKMQIINIPDYQEVYKLIIDQQHKVHQDTQFPNRLR